LRSCEIDRKTDKQRENVATANLGGGNQVELFRKTYSSNFQVYRYVFLVFFDPKFFRSPWIIILFSLTHFSIFYLPAISAAIIVVGSVSVVLYVGFTQSLAL